MNKLNLKQPKYILPAVILIPVIFVGINLIGVFGSSAKKDVSIVKEGEINTDMPIPNMDNENMKMQSKYESMMSEYGKIKDHAAVQGLDEDAIEMYDELGNSLYSESEIAMLDSLEKEKQDRLKELNNMQLQTMEMSGYNYSQNQYNNISRNPNNNNYSGTQQHNREEDDEFAQQIALLQKIANGEKIDINEEKANNNSMAEIIPNSSPTIEIDDDVVVHKVKKINTNHFNTIQKTSTNNNKYIKAMLDENIKAQSGSRLRIKLLDDIEIDGHILTKGSYLYAIVSGFTEQRIQANITSILVNNEILKVSLSIYDNDGIEGFYVPSSAFRDFQRDASSQALTGNNINITQNENQSLESMAFQTLQNVYQSATTAVSNNIKKNKAKLKYNTEVYLINTNNQN